MSTAVQQIKDRLGIAEVVGLYLKLEPAGANFRARCPFHQEKTPSFYVSPARGSYHCFGCNRGGDLISFVEEIEGVDFMGALKILAERAGIQLETKNLKYDPERENIFAALEAATRFYRANLAPDSPAQSYLLERGLTAETIEAFRLGLALPEWQSLQSHLTKAGFTEATLEAAGLVIKSNKPGVRSRYYDRFRGRIMFPLTDSSGRVVGFSGRVFGEAPPEAGKYINSPQTSVYDKSRVLYGFDRAKVTMRSKDAAVLVEGQIDLVLSHQAGVTNAVAVSGTALTREHLTAIGRLTKNLIMAFDGDQAGFGASARGILMALEAGLEVKAVRLPAGQDPADLIRQDPSAWPALLAQAEHVIDFLLGGVMARNLPARERAHAIKNEVYSFIAGLRQRIDQAHFIGKVAELTGLPDNVIRDEVAALGFAAAAGVPKPRPAEPAIVSRQELIEEKLVAIESWRAGAVKSELLPLAAARERLAPRVEALGLQAEILYGHLSPPELAEEVARLERDLELEFLKQELQRVTRHLAEAERKHESEKATEYLAECQALSRKINNLKLGTPYGQEKKSS